MKDTCRVIMRLERTESGQLKVVRDQEIAMVIPYGMDDELAKEMVVRLNLENPGYEHKYVTAPVFDPDEKERAFHVSVKYHTWELTIDPAVGADEDDKEYWERDNQSAWATFWANSKKEAADNAIDSFGEWIKGEVRSPF